MPRALVHKLNRAPRVAQATGVSEASGRNAGGLAAFVEAFMERMRPAVSSRRRVAAAFAGETFTESKVSRSSGSATTLLAWGKCADAMASGWLDAAETGSAPGRILVIAPDNARYLDSRDRARVEAAIEAARRDGRPARRIEGNHPVPRAASLAAGRAVKAFVAATVPGETLQVLLSGGASALAEAIDPAALPAGFTDAPDSLPSGVRGDTGSDAGHHIVSGVPGAPNPSDLALDRPIADGWDDGVADWLADWTAARLAAGIGIRELNTERAQISRLKGGRLGLRLFERGAHPRVWLVGDVAGARDKIARFVGSGPFWLADGRIEHRVLADGESLRDDARAALADLGLTTSGVESAPGVVHDAGWLPQHWTASDALPDPESLPFGASLWSGEVPVALPERPGRGGRAQHLALLWWLRLNQSRSGRAAGSGNFRVLAWASDGFDGSGDAAGVAFDVPSLAANGWPGDGPAQPEATCVAARAALLHADSHAFWQARAACGEAIVLPSGSTGTNQMDLLIVIRHAPPARDPGDASSRVPRRRC